MYKMNKNPSANSAKEIRNLIDTVRYLCYNILDYTNKETFDER